MDVCSVGGGGGVYACRDWLEPVIPPRQLCLCAAVYRPATTGYVRHSGGPAQPAEAASSTAYSPAATLSSSHYYYHILTLQNCSVCRVKYQGASDVKFEVNRLQQADSEVVFTLVPAVAWVLKSQFAPGYMHYNICFEEVSGKI